MAQMAKSTDKLENIIQKALSIRPKGANIAILNDAIAAAGINVSRRTLQRRLGRMEQAGAIARRGNSVATIYVVFV